MEKYIVLDPCFIAYIVKYIFIYPRNNLTMHVQRGTSMSINCTNMMIPCVALNVCSPHEKTKINNFFGLLLSDRK